MESEESLIHALKDCHGSSCVWKMVLPSVIVECFFRFSELRDWLTWDMKQKILVQYFEFKFWFVILCRNFIRHIFI